MLLVGHVFIGIYITILMHRYLRNRFGNEQMQCRCSDVRKSSTRADRILYEKAMTDSKPSSVDVEQRSPPPDGSKTLKNAVHKNVRVLTYQPTRLQPAHTSGARVVLSVSECVSKGQRARNNATVAQRYVALRAGASDWNTLSAPTVV